MNRLHSGRRRRRFEQAICSIVAILLVAAAVSALMLRLVRLAPAFGRWLKVVHGKKVKSRAFFSEEKKKEKKDDFFAS